MEHDQQQNLRQYVWNHLSFYAGERSLWLRLFISVGSALALGAAGLLRTEATEIVVAPLGLVLAILGVLFWIMNRGLSARVRQGEAALRHLDAELKLPNVKGGAPHFLRLLDQSAGEGDRAKGCCGGFDESSIASAVYLLFALLGLFFAVAPYYPREMPVKPVVIETPAPLVKATPAMPQRQAPFPQQTPPGFNPRRFSGATPPLGFPNRPTGFPRTPLGTPEGGAPAAPPARFNPPTSVTPVTPAGAVPPANAPNLPSQPSGAPNAVEPAKAAVAAPASAIAAPPAAAATQPATGKP